MFGVIAVGTLRTSSVQQGGQIMYRLTDPQTVEHFLRVNCTLVFKRVCTAKEKGDVLVWLGGIK